MGLRQAHCKWDPLTGVSVADCDVDKNLEPFRRLFGSDGTNRFFKRAGLPVGFGAFRVVKRTTRNNTTRLNRRGMRSVNGKGHVLIPRDCEELS